VHDLLFGWRWMLQPRDRQPAEGGAAERLGTAPR